MQSAHRAAAAQLQHANVAERPQFGDLVGEMQDPVDHRVFGEKAALTFRVGQQNHDTSREIRQDLHLVQELLELPIGRCRFLRRRRGRR